MVPLQQLLGWLEKKGHSRHFLSLPLAAWGFACWVVINFELIDGMRRGIWWAWLAWPILIGLPIGLLCYVIGFVIVDRLIKMLE